jgi:hypothetical protein
MSAFELFAKTRMWGAHIEIWMPGHLKVVKSSGNEEAIVPTPPLNETSLTMMVRLLIQRGYVRL